MNVTDDYNLITFINYTDILNDYVNFTISNCTNNEKNFDRIIPTLFLTIPCGLSFLCLISLMIYTLIKPLIKSN